MRFPKMIIKNSTQQFIISNILEHALSWKKVTFGKIAWQDSQGKVTFGKIRPPHIEKIFGNLSCYLAKCHFSRQKVTFGKIARVLIFSDMYKTRTFVFFSFFLINKIIKKIAKQGLIEQIRT